ncbi:MAG: EAL domain-containing protein [Candidatus Polarisedimenticolaceae bacterium]|nr:EAL domain-containing protein [Candidatus Polarisedimenticolaceae bacterium]
MSSSILNNLDIRHKLLLLVVFPVVALVIFTGYVIVDKWRQYGIAQVLQSNYQYSITLSKVIHAMQKERGLTAGFVGGAGHSFVDELKRQRQQTDDLVKQLRQGSAVMLLTADDPNIRARLNGLVRQLEGRLAWREKVDRLSDEDVFAKYTQFNSDAIYLIQALGDIADDAELVRFNRTYGDLLWIQEYAGQERGAVNGILSAGVVDTKSIAAVSGYVAKQAALIDELKKMLWRPVEVQLILDDASVAEVQQMRKVLLLRVERIDILNELQLTIGYGGFIHQFKNYVIRGDIASKNRVVERHRQAQQALDHYREIGPISEGEIAAIEQIQRMLDAYLAKLEIVAQMLIDNASISQIDRRVMIDDSQAVEAILYLGSAPPDINADTWFIATTKRIDRFKALSDELKQIGIQYLDEKIRYTHLVLITCVIFTIAALLVVLFLGVVITHRLVMGSAKIINALSLVEKSGDFSGHIEIDGCDEIAAMGHAFNHLIEGRRAAEHKLWLASKVFSSTIDGIMVTDADERIISVNPAFTKITGYREEEVIGKTPRRLSSNRHDGAFFKVMWQEIKAQGFWQGEIWNRRKSGEVYPQWQHITMVEDAQQQPVNYIAVFSDISVIKHSQEKLEHLAHHDPLTSLPNRILLDLHLTQGIERAKRQNSVLAVLFLDLDRFKNVNDSLGHPAGDELLKKVSLRLKQILRAEDLVARLGGDEFALVLEAPSDGQSVARIAQKCIDAFVAPFDIEDCAVYTSTSIGISIYPDDGVTVDALLKHADTAMYHAKGQGRNSYRFYNKRMTQFAVDRLALEVKLRQALEQDELVLQYQPQVSLSTGEISGVEALIRWRQADGTLRFPDQFIPVAEESALIERVDRWVLNEACRQAKRWLDMGLPTINMAVNISGFSIEHGLLLDMVEEALKNSQLDPRVLELEITEGYLMQHREQATMIIEQLKEQGVSFSIDDFGTGYSSLGYLKMLPINRLKIDQSFVRDVLDDESDQAIIRAVIALGHSMQMQIVAEGVESEAQADFLNKLDCDFAQGYLYSKSVSAEEIEDMLRQ